jgi:predicted metalloprotease with PDZ domain
MKKIILIALIMSSISELKAESIKYKLSFPEAQAHYVDVEIELNGFKEKELELKLPVWTPGSYLVREFARHVEGVQAMSNSVNTKIEKINKNTWKVANANGNLKISYRVYAFELTVRTSFIDESHAALNGSNIFMYVEGHKNLKSEVNILPRENWKKISCGLEHDKNNLFKLYADNYDVLADSPIEIGNQDIIEFDALGIPHYVAMVGPGTYDREKIKKDFIKIIETANSVFGKNPVKNYTFIVHNVNSGGGGLEHLNSTSLLVQRNAYSNENTYNSFLGLVAHEYFHLWNVKRLRPSVLGPFDYDQENYTHLLWVSEGFTAYYDNWIVKRAGYYTEDKYLEIIANEISAQVNLPGDKVQALSESSFDAWIKYYRRNENSNNSQVSYYDKGSIAALLINLMIIEHSAGKQNLDDLMKFLYKEYYEKKDIGFDNNTFKQAAEKFTGRNLDKFYAEVIDGTASINYENYLAIAGLKLVNQNANKNESYLGVTATNTNGKLNVTAVSKNGPAYTAGLNVNDEIIAIDNYRVDDLTKALTLKKVNDKISVLVSRDGVLKTIEITVAKNPNVKYKLEKNSNITKEQELALNKLLGK